MIARILLAGMLLCAVLQTSPGAAQSHSPIDPPLADTLNALPADQTVNVIVILKNQTDVRVIKGHDGLEKRRNLVTALHDKSDTTQTSMRSLLQVRNRQGRVPSYTPLWVINGIAVTASAAVINELAARPEVDHIVLDAMITAPTMLAAQTVTPVEANLSVINAPALWALGYQGQGVVVASMDTGVDITFQPDLLASWRGGGDSWYDPYGQHATPADLNGHGTSTMGLMVGGSSGGSSIGVAPRAKWIAAKIFNDAGAATLSAIHLAFQWFLNPSGNLAAPDAPNIVNASWTLSSIGCDLTFEPDLEALVTAGITPVFAAGNFGPTAPSDTSPSNNPAAFAVGATDNANLIASFSSRGGTSCGRGATTTYPAVVAPGVAVKTTDLAGLYSSVSGTSFSAPHVSGALAVLLSAFPTLTVTQQENALVSSARDLGIAGPDNVYGAGRIDLLAAYNALSATAVLASNTWYVTTFGDSVLDGDVVTRSGSLRFTLAHAVSGELVSFDHLVKTVDIIDVNSTLVVPDGVAVGHTRNQACGGVSNPLINIRAQAPVTEVVRLGTGSTLRNVDIVSGTISVRATGANADVCGVGLGFLHDATLGLIASPPSTAAFIVDGAHAVLHQSDVNGTIIVNPQGSDTQIGDTMTANSGMGNSDANQGACGNQGKCPVSILADVTGAAQRVTIRDPFPRALNGLVGNGISGGDDVITHTNNWAQMPFISTAVSTDHFATVVVTGTANPRSLVDVYFDDHLTLVRQTPVTADTGGIFTFTAPLSGMAVSIFVVSTLSDTVHMNRMGSSSEWSVPKDVVLFVPPLLPRVWLPLVN